jgi:hypothetical protein
MSQRAAARSRHANGPGSMPGAIKVSVGFPPWFVNPWPKNRHCADTLLIHAAPPGAIQATRFRVFVPGELDVRESRPATVEYLARTAASLTSAQ